MDPRLHSTGETSMSQIRSDLRHAVRMLWKNRGFTALAVLALGIGIGANASIYTMADVLLYRPLQLPDLDRAVQIYATLRDGGDRTLTIAAADLRDFQRDSKTLDHISGIASSNLALTGGGDPEMVSAYRAGAGLFDALAAKPVLGRTFLPAEGNVDGTDRVAILSYRLWMSRFAGDPNVLHRTIHLDGKTFEVIGVMQKEFRVPADSQLWIPLHFTAAELASRGTYSINAVGRIKEGVSFDQANAEVATLAGRLSSQYPDTHKKRSAHVVLVRESLSGELTGDYMRMLIGAVGFLLLIACANVANLQFARISLRGREIAVRSALGAARWNIIRHLLAESIVLSGLGVILGILIAVWGLDLLRAGMPPEVERYIPGWNRMSLNLPVLGITILVALVAGILSGILPAWTGSKVDILGALKEGGRSSSSGKGRHRLRSLLVVSEIALSLVLLIGAGLMAKGLRNVTLPSPTVDPAHVLKFELQFPESRYAGTPEIREFERQLLGKLNSLSGVMSAALVSDMPYGGNTRLRRVSIDGKVLAPGMEPLPAQVQAIDPNYFRTMRMRIVNGRDLSASDGGETQPVAVVSQRFVRRYLDGRDPIGRRLRFTEAGKPGPWVTVVGVATDIIHEPFDPQPRATVYQPYPQVTERNPSFLLRTAGDPLSLAAAVRAQVASIQPDQPIGGLQTFAKTIHDNLLGVSYVAVLMGIFGIVALLLSAIGVYGVMAYSVAERTSEIGLRMALGASYRDVLWMVGRWGIALAAVGVALGIPAALGFAKLLSGLLVGVGSFDVPAFTAGAGVLCAAAMIACCVPVWRALTVDPIIALRDE